jgi:hypothetical protein
VVQRCGCDALLLLHENPSETRKRNSTLTFAAGTEEHLTSSRVLPGATPAGATRLVDGSPPAASSSAEDAIRGPGPSTISRQPSTERSSPHPSSCSPQKPKLQRWSDQLPPVVARSASILIPLNYHLSTPGRRSLGEGDINYGREIRPSYLFSFSPLQIEKIRDVVPGAHPQADGI